MKTKTTAIVAALAMILGCFSTTALLAQSSKKEKSPRKEKMTDGKVIETGQGIEYKMTTVGPSVTLEEAVPKLVKGKTTLAEVLQLLGQPTNVGAYGEGGQTATYVWRSDLQLQNPNMGRVMGRAAMGPFAIFGASKRFEAAKAAADDVRKSVKTLTVMFGPDEVLKGLISNPMIPTKPAPPDPQKTTALPEKGEKSEIQKADSPLIAATPPAPSR